MGRERVVIHKESLTFMQRKLCRSQLRNMSETLKTTDWDGVLHYDKVSESYDSFIAHFIEYTWHDINCTPTKHTHLVSRIIAQCLKNT